MYVWHICYEHMRMHHMHASMPPHGGVRMVRSHLPYYTVLSFSFSKNSHYLVVYGHCNERCSTFIWMQAIMLATCLKPR